MGRNRNEKFIRAFGERIKNLREKAGLTQESLSYSSGLTVNQIGRIERGEINTTISSVMAIAKALKIKPSVLFDFPFEEKNQQL